MKRTIASALFILSSIFTVGAASAQDRGLSANVPFEFTVGGKLLPAGTYTITSPSSGVVSFKSEDSRITAMTISTFEGKDPGKRSELIFDRYGKQYFLRDVVSPTVANMNLHIPTSKTEKQVQRQEASLAGSEPVQVAAR